MKKLEKGKDGFFLKAPPKAVKVLGDLNFNSQLAISTEAEDKMLFVKFFMPKCNHCQALKPKWEKLGEELQAQGNGGIVLAEVNCESQKATCDTQGVGSHPTLIKYTKAMMKDEYS